MLACFKNLDKNIDYKGQNLSYKLMIGIFVIGYSISFIVGIKCKNLFYTLCIGIATAVLSFLISVPSWPFYRRNPMKFKKTEKQKN